MAKKRAAPQVKLEPLPDDAQLLPPGDDTEKEAAAAPTAPADAPSAAPRSRTRKAATAAPETAAEAAEAAPESQPASSFFASCPRCEAHLGDGLDLSAQSCHACGYTIPAGVIRGRR